MAYKLQINPSVEYTIKNDVVTNIISHYCVHISSSDWADDSRYYTKGEVKYNTNINYNTSTINTFWDYALKPFESGSTIIDSFLSENGHIHSSYTLTTGSFTSTEYWATAGNNSLPTMSTSPYNGPGGIAFQQKYFPQVEVEE